MEFDDPENPREVARYQVPESGPHNYWIDWEEEILYVAHFDAGLRVVDISGELMGDLYRQGREIAKFYSDDSKGFIPNAPFARGTPTAQRHHLFHRSLQRPLGRPSSFQGRFESKNNEDAMKPGAAQ